MKKITILFALFIGVIFGCQNSDLELAPTENLTGNEQLIPLRETFDFTYKGVTYSSPYYMENDTLMILEDEKVATLYDQLQELPELATCVTPEGNIEYFDTYSDLQKEKPKRIKNNTLNFPPAYPTLTLYEHAHYNLDKTGHYVDFQLAYINIPDLDVYGINEMISSVRVHGSGSPISPNNRVTFFRNKNYEAQSITFDFHNAKYDDEFSIGFSTFYYLKVNNLKKYKVKSGINWNDRISSFRVS